MLTRDRIQHILNTSERIMFNISSILEYFASKNAWVYNISRGNFKKFTQSFSVGFCNKKTNCKDVPSGLIPSKKTPVLITKKELMLRRLKKYSFGFFFPLKKIVLSCRFNPSKWGSLFIIVDIFYLDYSYRRLAKSQIAFTKFIIKTFKIFFKLTLMEFRII